VNPACVTTEVLEQARAFFEERGSHGCEGTAMIAAGPDRVGRRLVIPEQRAGQVPDCWVEVTGQGKLQLAVALLRDETYIARIHSHPAAAFHSETDDKNPGLTNHGALSIVVPFFGLGLRRGLDACAVYRLGPEGWAPLDVGPARDEELTVQR
jgi:hypothetical protein